MITLSFAVLVALSGCKKKVVNPADSADFDKKGATSQDVEDGNEDKNYDELKDLLAKERAERIKSDEGLQIQINMLVADLADLLTKISTAIADLDKEVSDTQSKLDAYIASNDKSLGDLASRMQQGNPTLAQQLRTEINLDLKNLKVELTQADQATKDALTKVIQGLEVKLTKNDGDLAADLRAELLAESARLEASLAAFKSEAAATYATQSELRVLFASIEGVKKTLAVLSQKFDSDLKTLATTMQNEHKSDISQLMAEIAAIRTDLTTLDTDIQKMQMTLDKKISTLRNEIRTEFSSIKLEINQIQKQDAIQTAAIASLSLKLQSRTEFLFHFFSAVARDLKGKISELESQMKQASKEQKDIIKVQVSQLNKKIDSLADEERAARAEIELQIREISDQIAAMEIFARESRALIVANRVNIELTNADLAKAKVEFRKELDILKNEFSKRLAAVKQTAITMTRTLGIQVQQQFVNINAQIAVLNQRITANTRLIVIVVSDLIGGDDARRKPIETFLTGRMPTLVNSLKQVGFDRVMLENEVVNLISPFSPASGVNPDALNTEFKELLAQNKCQGFQGEGIVPSSLNNREWFMHIAGEYAILLASNVRTGNPEIDRIFYGHQSKIRSVESISHSLIAAALSSYSAGNSCQRATTAWAKSTFLAQSVRGKAIRDALTNSQKVKVLAVKFGEAVNSFSKTADTFGSDFLNVIVAAGVNRDLASTWLFTVSNNTRPIDRIISYTLDMVEDYRQLAESDSNRNRIFSLAKTVSSQQQLIGNATRSVAALESDFSLLKKQVETLALSVTDIKKELATLKGSQITALNLIAELAGRLGFGDIVDRADDEIINLGGTPTVRVAEGCYGVQHYYNHATNPKLPVARCESLMSSHNSKLNNLELTKCAIHGGFQKGNEIIAYTWGNQSQVTNGWSAQNGQIGGHQVANGLLIKQYDPTHAKAKQLAARKAGSTFPADKESTLMYRVLGNAHKFKIAVRSEANAAHFPYDVTVNAAEFLVGQTNGLNVYEIPLPKAIGKLGACTWNRNVKITALSASGAAGKLSCDHRFHTFSPIVLNLEDDGMVATLPPSESNVFFDLDGNGIKDKTGWIKGASGLLARDIDKNGRIDDGRELFGEATLVDGKNAENGYQALAQFDTNGDGEIDARDKIYSELLVWRDLNGDGTSQSFEMKSLADLGITSIKTTYDLVKADDQLQADSARSEGNIVKYQSTYSKKDGCNKGVCSSFDVYFGSSEYTTADR